MRGLMLVVAALLVAAREGRAQGACEIGVTWLGHAGFAIESPGGTRIVIDPWLTDDPYTPTVLKDSLWWAEAAHRPAAILLTHPHEDHTADAPWLARVSGAKVVGTLETLQGLAVPDAQALSVNAGGALTIGDVTVHAVPAMHSAATSGRPLGYVLEFAGGRTLYHTGDTWVFGDMAWIERLFRPEILLVAAGGGRWGMSPAVAREAVRTYFHPRTIVPMHYGTAAFPLASEAEVRRAFAGDRRLRVLTPGERAVLPAPRGRC